MGRNVWAKILRSVLAHPADDFDTREILRDAQNSKIRDGYEKELYIATVALSLLCRMQGEDGCRIRPVSYTHLVLPKTIWYSAQRLREMIAWNAC